MTACFWQHPAALFVLFVVTPCIFATMSSPSEDIQSEVEREIEKMYDHCEEPIGMRANDREGFQTPKRIRRLGPLASSESLDSQRTRVLGERTPGSTSPVPSREAMLLSPEKHLHEWDSFTSEKKIAVMYVAAVEYGGPPWIFRGGPLRQSPVLMQAEHETGSASASEPRSGA